MGVSTLLCAHLYPRERYWQVVFLAAQTTTGYGLFSWPDLAQDAVTQITVRPAPTANCSHLFLIGPKGIYPTAIVVIVLFQKSYADHIQGSAHPALPRFDAAARRTAAVELATSGSVWIIDRRLDTADTASVALPSPIPKLLPADGSLNPDTEVFTV